MKELPVDLEQLVAHIDRPGAQPLELLTDAVILSGRLGELGDQVIDHFVQRARDAGASWADIGEGLGVSKQAAQKRFVGERRSPFRSSKRGLFTRFDSTARFAVKLAVRRAQESGASEIGTLHLIAGLCDEGSGAASEILSQLTGGTVRDEVEEALAESESSLSHGHIPFDADSKKVLELALREAIRAKSRSIGSEHVLLGLLRDEGSPGARLLSRMGVTHEAVEQWVEENRHD